MERGPHPCHGLNHRPYQGTFASTPPCIGGKNAHIFFQTLFPLTCHAQCMHVLQVLLLWWCCAAMTCVGCWPHQRLCWRWHHHSQRAGARDDPLWPAGEPHATPTADSAMYHNSHIQQRRLHQQQAVDVVPWLLLQCTGQVQLPPVVGASSSPSSQDAAAAQA